MRNKCLILLALCFQLGLGACKHLEDLSSTDWAVQSTKELGIPVYLWSSEDDSCALAQIRMVAEKGYLALSAVEQGRLKQRLVQSVNSIVVNRTRNLGELRGEKATVELLRKVCVEHTRPFNQTSAGHNESPRYLECTLKVVASAVAHDSRVTADGQTPGTEVAIGSDWEISPRAARDFGTHRVLRAVDPQVFARSLAQDADLNAALASGQLTLIEASQHTGDVDCGRLRTLDDLLAEVAK